MKVTSELAWNFIRHGKKQTWLVASGIFMSVFFLSSLLLFINADEQFEKKRAIYLYSDYEIIYSDLQDEERLYQFLDKNYEDEELLSENLKLYEYGTAFTNHERILISAYQEVPKNTALSLQVGRYPENEHEILISDRYLSEYDLELGDTITLSVLSSGKTMEKQFLITGSHYDFRSLSNNEYVYQMYTYSSICKDADFTNGYIKLNHMKKAEMDAFLEKLAQEHIVQLVINDLPYEINYGSFKLTEKESLMKLFYFVLMIVYVTLINIFLLSMKLKEKQLGMLKSVGTTNRQIVGMSIWEVLLYSCLIIPIAFMASVLVMYIAFQVMYMIAPIHANPFPYEIVMSPGNILFIVFVNVLVLLCCNLLPLLHIHNRSAIQLIKNEGNNKIKVYRNYHIYERIFGFPAQIAIRNRKRDRLSHLSIMISCISSVVLMIHGYFMCVTLFRQTAFFDDSKVIIYVGIGIMMSFLTIVNIYLLISSNVMLRSKEQMILTSIGLEKKQLFAMIFLENGAEIIKSLILGIVLSLYLNYQNVDPKHTTYSIDWYVILFVILLFFFSTLITMGLNYRKLIEMNIITTIRE